MGQLQAANTELVTVNAELEGRTAELNRLDAFHRSFLNSLEHGIAVLDRDDLVTAWNLMAEPTARAEGIESGGGPTGI